MRRPYLILLACLLAGCVSPRPAAEAPKAPPAYTGLLFGASQAARRQAYADYSVTVQKDSALVGGHATPLNYLEDYFRRSLCQSAADEVKVGLDLDQADAENRALFTNVAGIAADMAGLPHAGVAARDLIYWKHDGPGAPHYVRAVGLFNQWLFSQLRPDQAISPGEIGRAVQAPNEDKQREMEYKAIHQKTPASGDTE